MSDYTIETIELTEASRLRVEVDQDTTNPRQEWEMLTGFVKIEGRGDSRRIDVEPVHDAPVPIAEAHRRIGWDLSEDAVERWARIFHGMHIEYDSEHGGYWFVDPDGFRANFPDAGSGKVARIRPARVDGIFQANVYEAYEQDALKCQAEVISQERETYRQWAEGEVYGVILERKVTQVTYQAERTELGFEIDTTHPPVVIDQWDEVESTWGCYLGDDYTAQIVADEYFPLTDEEFIALGLPGSPLSGLAPHTVDDIRAAEEDVPLIDEATGRLTPAGELYLRDYRRHGGGERREAPAEPATGVSGEW